MHVRQLYRRVRDPLHRLRRAVRRGLRFWFDVRLRRAPLRDLTRYEQRVYSQNGEDGILEAIFARIGTTNKYFVEFGVESGRECNTRRLAEHCGWTGLLMDAGFEDPSRNLRREYITAESINDLLAKYGVPHEFDLLVIDIDGNDYWVWKNLAVHWRPRVVVIEYNAQAGPDASLVIPYDPTFRWDGTDYYGASLRALATLGAERGYRLVACDSTGVNAFFVREDLAAGAFARRGVEALYRPMRHGPQRRGHPHDPTRRLAPA